MPNNTAVRKRVRTRDFFRVGKTCPSQAACFDRRRFDFATEEESHGQLVRCTEGELELFGTSGEWSIPDNHMVYIPGGRPFRLRATRSASAVVVKFCQNEVEWRHDGCWVSQVSLFAAGMIDYATRWSLDADPQCHKSKSFFITMGDMLPDWFLRDRILWTPYASDTAVQRVIDFVLHSGPAVSLSEAACVAGISERTLRRRMRTELGQSWREFICERRMNRAMTLLREGRATVTETALEVGFSSSAAFAHAFGEHVGKTPTEYARAS